MTFKKWLINNMQDRLMRYEEAMFIDSELYGVSYGIDNEQFAIVTSSGGVKLRRAEAKKLAEEILEILEIY